MKNYSDVLFTETRGELRDGKVKGICTRTWKAGDMLEVEIYPMWDTKGMLAAREARKAATREAQKKVNRRNAQRKLGRLLNANFTRKDLHVSLTYKGKAPDQKQAKKDMQNFLRRVKRLRAKAGLDELKYVYVLEWEDDPEKQKKRIHLHVVMSGGLERSVIEKCWRKGYANADRLQPGNEGLLPLAKYLTKTVRAGRSFSCSRNLKRPQPTVSLHKISRRQAFMAARELETDGRTILEKKYPGYQYVDLQAFYPSMESVDGVYLYGIMRRKGAERGEGWCD